MDKKVIGKPDNDKKSNVVVIGRALKLIEYIRKNTDSEHTITQARMRNDNSINDYMGTKITFKKMIKDLAIILNFEDDFLKKDSERRLLFRGFQDLYDEFDEFVPVFSAEIVKTFAHLETNIAFEERITDFGYMIRAYKSCCEGR